MFLAWIVLELPRTRRDFYAKSVPYSGGVFARQLIFLHPGAKTQLATTCITFLCHRVHDFHRNDNVCRRLVSLQMKIPAVATATPSRSRNPALGPARACAKWVATSATSSTHWPGTTAVWDARTRAGCRLCSTRWSTLWTSSGTRIAAHVTASPVPPRCLAIFYRWVSVVKVSRDNGAAPDIIEYGWCSRPVGM